MRERLIVALDVDGIDKAKELADILYPTVRIFKIGSQLFTSCGTEIIKMIQRKGGKVFLDLKFHDIPNTVRGAVESATRLGVYMMTIHTLGGEEMLRKAAESARLTSEKLKMQRPKLLGVTVLTSMDGRALRKIGMGLDVKEAVRRLAGSAKKSGLDGVVASAKEISMLRKTAGKDFIIVTPGIRPAGSSKGDQKRVATPGEAIKRGADCIVVGRSVIGAGDPKLEAEKILMEMKDAESG